MIQLDNYDWVQRLNAALMQLIVTAEYSKTDAEAITQDDLKNAVNELQQLIPNTIINFQIEEAKQLNFENIIKEDCFKDKEDIIQESQSEILQVDLKDLTVYAPEEYSTAYKQKIDVITKVIVVQTDLLKGMIEADRKEKQAHQEAVLELKQNKEETDQAMKSKDELLIDLAGYVDLREFEANKTTLEKLNSTAEENLSKEQVQTKAEAYKKLQEDINQQNEQLKILKENVEFLAELDKHLEPTVESIIPQTLKEAVIYSYKLITDKLTLLNEKRVVLNQNVKAKLIELHRTETRYQLKQDLEIISKVQGEYGEIPTAKIVSWTKGNLRIIENYIMDAVANQSKLQVEFSAENKAQTKNLLKNEFKNLTALNEVFNQWTQKDETTNKTWLETTRDQSAKYIADYKAEKERYTAKAQELANSLNTTLQDVRANKALQDRLNGSSELTKQLKGIFQSVEIKISPWSNLSFLKLGNPWWNIDTTKLENAFNKLANSDAPIDLNNLEQHITRFNTRLNEGIVNTIPQQYHVLQHNAVAAIAPEQHRPEVIENNLDQQRLADEIRNKFLKVEAETAQLQGEDNSKLQKDVKDFKDKINLTSWKKFINLLPDNLLKRFYDTEDFFDLEHRSVNTLNNLNEEIDTFLIRVSNAKRIPRDNDNYFPSYSVATGALGQAKNALTKNQNTRAMDLRPSISDASTNEPGTEAKADFSGIMKILTKLQKLKGDELQNIKGTVGYLLEYVEPLIIQLNEMRTKQKHASFFKDFSIKRCHSIHIKFE